MKRIFPLLLALVGCLTFAGCPGGEEGDGADGATSTTDGGNSSADGSSGGGSFAAGVDSGRAEDGSDEDK